MQHAICSQPSIRRELPPDNAELRAAIYAGDVFHLDANDRSRALCEAALELLRDTLETDEPQRAQFSMSNDDLFSRIGAVRKRLADERRFEGMIEELLASLGFAPAEWVFDALRMRAVTHEGHANPRALPAYTAHRDTWYANSRAQLNWWLPLIDVDAGRTFSIYPCYFHRAIANSSGDFDYDEWIRNVGWQSYSPSARSGKAVYPEPTEPLEEEPAWRIPMRAGDILIFSASHLHQTFPNTSGVTRFSLDFRTVRPDDHRSGIGAPDPDNLSTGSAMVEYRPFGGARPS